MKLKHSIRNFLIKSRNFYYNYFLRKPRIYLINENKFQAYKRIGSPKINLVGSKLEPYFAIRKSSGDMMVKLKKSIKGINEIFSRA